MAFLMTFFHWYLIKSVVSRQLIMFALSLMSLLYLNYCEYQTPQNYEIQRSHEQWVANVCPTYCASDTKQMVDHIFLPPHIRIKIYNLLKLPHVKHTNRKKYVSIKVLIAKIKTHACLQRIPTSSYASV